MNITMALDPFQKKAAGKKSEAVSDVNLEKDPTIQSALALYRTQRRGYYEDEIPILTPQQINRFYQEYVELPGIISPGNDKDRTYSFLTLLINRSHQVGHNDFYLNTQAGCMWALGRMVRGSPNRRLSITIHGDVGHDYASYCEYVDSVVLGNAGQSAAHYAENSTFVFKGSVDHGAGSQSKNSYLHIENLIDTMLGEYAKNSYFMIKGRFLQQNYHHNDYPHNSTFHVFNKDAYDALSNGSNFHKGANTVILK